MDTIVLTSLLLILATGAQEASQGDCPREAVAAAAAAAPLEPPAGEEELMQMTLLQSRLLQSRSGSALGASPSRSAELAMGNATNSKVTGSCATYGCIDYQPGQDCQCNYACTKFHSCCADYEAVCAAHSAPSHSGPYHCITSLRLPAIVKPSMKGVALDDTTLEQCADKIPVKWPGTEEDIKVIRLFKPWGMTQPKFFHGDMVKAWDGLKAFAEAAGAKFLLGVSVTCNSYNDNKEWEAGKRFIQHVGADRIMGIAVGNEIDLQVGGSHPACVNNLWYSSGYYNTLVRRVEDFDSVIGSSSLPITAVLSNGALQGDKFSYKVGKFVKAAVDKYGTRFAVSVNIYPQFSSGLKSAGCYGAAEVGQKFSLDSPAGFVPNVAKAVRSAMAKAGASNNQFWIGETGWATHGYCVLGCDHACHSRSGQQSFYEHWLQWDPSDLADMAFYFTLRDSSVFGQREEFGLISSCHSTHCKFQR